VTELNVAHNVRVLLPTQLRTLAGVPREVSVTVFGDVTQRSVLDALETSLPTLGGTIRDRATARRRPFMRFFACEEDLSHEPPDAPLPDAVASGREPFIVLGAIAGG
jgi:sulfur-carrier protein